jgi:hypothetical protein
MVRKRKILVHDYCGMVGVMAYSTMASASAAMRGADSPELTAMRRPDSYLHRRRQRTTSGGLELGRQPQRTVDVGATLVWKNRAHGRPWQRAGGVWADLGGRVPRRRSSSVVEPSLWATGNQLPVARSHYAGKGGPRRGGGGVGWRCTSRSYSG